MHDTPFITTIYIKIDSLAKPVFAKQSNFKSVIFLQKYSSTHITWFSLDTT